MKSSKVIGALVFLTLLAGLALVSWRAFSGAAAPPVTSKVGPKVRDAQASAPAALPPASSAPSVEHDVRIMPKFATAEAHVRVTHREVVLSVHSFLAKHFPDLKNCTAKTVACRKEWSKGLASALANEPGDVATGGFGARELLADHGPAAAGRAAESWALEAQKSADPVERVVGLKLYQQLAAGCHKDCSGLAEVGYGQMGERVDPEIVLLSRIHQNWPASSEHVAASFIEAASDGERDVRARTASVRALGHPKLSEQLGQAVKTLPAQLDKDGVWDVTAAMSHCGSACESVVKTSLSSSNPSVLRAAMWAAARLPKEAMSSLQPQLQALAANTSLSYADREQLRYLQGLRK